MPTQAEIDRCREIATQLAQADSVGFFTFVNALWILAGILLLVAVSWLCQLYLIPWIKELPETLREIAFHLACIAAMFVPAFTIEGGGAVAISFAGCLAWLGALAYTQDLHFTWKNFERAGRIHAALVFAVWTSVALLLESSVIGFLATLAYGWMIGALFLPVFEMVYFDDKDRVPLAMIAAAVLVVTFIALDGAPHLHLFRTGAMIVGGTTWFGGCLVLASKHYRFSLGRYLAMQLLAVTSALIAMYVGMVYDFGGLDQAAISFFVVYALTKFFEIRWREVGYAWMLLALAVLTYAGAFLFERYG